MKRLIGVFLLFVALPLSATDWIVSTSGTAGGAGTVGSPWDITTAFGSKVATVLPGDNVYLRTGNYTFAASTTMRMRFLGTSANRITIATYPSDQTYVGEPSTLARIDVKNTVSGLLFEDSGTTPIGPQYVSLKNLEIYNSNTTRTSGTPGTNIWVNAGNGIQIVNCIIHDGVQSIYWQPASVDTLAYGNLMYYNGQTSPPDQKHGVYGQGGTRNTTTQNIIFNIATGGLHNWPHAPADTCLDQTNTENVTFYSGQLAAFVQAPNVYPGGDAPCTRLVHTGNYDYQKVSSTNSSRVGYSAGCLAGPTFNSNYTVGQVEFTKCTNLYMPDGSSLTMTGNTFLFSPPTEKPSFGGAETNINLAGYPGNTYSASTPVAQKIAYWANAKQTGRGHIVVYNWTAAATASLDLSQAGIDVNDTYEIRDAQLFFGTAVKTGTYAGGSVSVNIQADTVSVPIGYAALTDAQGNHSTDFKAFVIIKTGHIGNTPTPSFTATSSPTFTSTPTPTPSPSKTFTPSATFTATATFTPSVTSGGPTLTPSLTPTPNPNCLYWHAESPGLMPYYLSEPCGLTYPHPHQTVTPSQ